MGKDTEDPEQLYQKAMELIGNDESNVHTGGFLDSESFQYLLRAGELGHSESQLLLGMTYSYAYAHDLDNEDLAEISRGWYAKAVENGNLRAMLIVSRGNDSKDLFQKVVDSDPTDPRVQYEIGTYYLFGHTVEEDHSAAAEWLIRSAEQGEAMAMFYLSTMYLKGDGVEQSDEKAFQYSMKAAELGLSTSQYHVGWHYCQGVGVERSYGKALEWFERAVENGDTMSMISLGEMYEAGLGVEESLTKAAEFYSKAAEAEDPCGMVYLGHMYAEGLGVEQSDRKAYNLYRQAVNHIFGNLAVERLKAKAMEDDDIAMFVLGECYEGGLNVKPSYEKALEYYTKAAALDCGMAIAKLSFIKKQDLS